jgi:chromosome partitioning protein
MLICYFLLILTVWEGIKMAYTIAMVAQKGGVGKSTLARMMAVEAAKGDLTVKIADLDVQQTTCVIWAALRAEGGIQPDIRVESYRSVETALKEANDFDLYIIDGAAESSTETLKACLAADLVIIPTGANFDTLRPSVVLANNLFKKGVALDKIAFAFSITPDSVKQVEIAREYLETTPYRLLDGDVPFRPAFHKALDKGMAITETPFPTLRQRAEEMAQNIIDAVVENKNKEREMAG